MIEFSERISTGSFISYIFAAGLIFQSFVRLLQSVDVSLHEGLGLIYHGGGYYESGSKRSFYLQDANLFRTVKYYRLSL